MPDERNIDRGWVDAALDRGATALPPLPAGISRRIAAEMTHQPLHPVTPIRSASSLAAQSLLLFVLLAVALASAMKLAGIPAMSGLQLVFMSSILALGAVLLSQSLAWQMSPGSLQKISASAAVTLLIATLLAAFPILFPWRAPEAFFARGWHCFLVGTAVALVASVPFWLLVRRGAPLDFTRLGATLGAITGLLAVTVLQFTCDHQDLGHLATWHGGVLVVASVVGAVVGYCGARYSGSRHSA
jgi:hypothetical protein